MEDLLRAFERFQEAGRRAQDTIGRYSGMKDQIAEIESVVRSSDRAVTVVAGPGGAIKDIRFTSDALRQSPQALGNAVMATLRSAVADAVRQQAAVVQEFVGDDIQVVDQVLETQAEVLGTSVEALRTAEPPDGTSRRWGASQGQGRQPIDDEEDYGFRYDEGGP
jgi:DNA-binding protein YbaB